MSSLWCREAECPVFPHSDDVAPDGRRVAMRPGGQTLGAGPSRGARWLLGVSSLLLVLGWSVPGSAQSTVPDPPTGLTAVRPGNSLTQVNLSWTAPTNDGDSPVTGYKIELSAQTSISTGSGSPLISG